MKKLRVGEGMTQELLAKRLGVVVSTIGGIERGDNPTDEEKARKIAVALGKPVEEIFKAHKTLKDRFTAR